MPLLSLGQNVGLDSLSSIEISGQSASEIWAYADSNGNEYALMGTNRGFHVIDVTTPTNPLLLFYVPGVLTTWRDVKTWSHYAYLVHEGSSALSSGLQIFDLSYLPDSLPIVSTGLGTGFQSAHNIFIDENGIGYICGGNNIFPRGVEIIDIASNPTNPAVLGTYTANYVHDLFVRGDTMWTAEINAGQFSVVDVSDKAAPQVLATKSTQLNFTHNVWLTDDGNYLLTTDERPDAEIGIYDVSDLNDIEKVDFYQTNPGSGILPHNVFVDGDLAYISYYTDGVIVLDISQPENVIEIGRFDTSPLSNSTFNGCWGVYSYLPSGNVLASDRQTGLFVLGTDSLLRACYLEGTATEYGSNNLLFQVSVDLIEPLINTSTNFLGEYRTGLAQSGSYTVVFSKSGYLSDTVFNVPLSNGNIYQLDLALIPEDTTTFSGYIKTTDSIAITDAQVWLIGPDTSRFTFSDTSGYYAFDSVAPGNYQLQVAKWGYHAQADTLLIATTVANADFYLTVGYKDDFLLDLGWTNISTATSGLWERGVPQLALADTLVSQPGEDLENDLGEQAYLTGNMAGNADLSDVDSGYVQLLSPLMDLRDFDWPVVNVWQWFSIITNGDSTLDNNMSFSLVHSNGITPLIISTSSTMAWEELYLPLPQTITKIDSAVQLLVAVVDSVGNSIVDAGIDGFETKALQETGLPIPNFGSLQQELCLGDSLYLTDGSTGIIDTWLWEITSNSYTVASSQQHPRLLLDSTGTYTVKLFLTNSQGTISLIKETYITVSASLQIELTTVNESFIDSSDGAVFINVLSGTPPYTFNYTPLLPDTNQHQNLVPGIYDVSITDTNNCSLDTLFEIAIGVVFVDTTIIDTTIIDTTIIDTTTSIILISPSEGMTVYPNPFSGSFFISTAEYTPNTILTLTNILGERLYEIPLFQKEESLELNLADGMYIIQLRQGNTLFKPIRILKQ